MSTMYDSPNRMVVGSGSSNITDRLAALAGVAEALVTISKTRNIKMVVIARSIFMGVSPCLTLILRKSSVFLIVNAKRRHF
jgi:hypothetical protein